MFWGNIKDKDAACFKRLSGVCKKTFRLMVRAVVRWDEKIVAKKGNRRSRPFSLCVEDPRTYGADADVLPAVPHPVSHRRHLWHQRVSGMPDDTACGGVLEKIPAFKLPGKKKLSGTSQQVTAILIDATEMTIERP